MNQASALQNFGFKSVDILSIVSFPFAYSLCFCATFLPLSASRTGLRNLQQQLQLRPLQSHRILTQVYMQYLSYFFELIFMWPLGLIKITNIESFANLLSHVSKKYNLTENQGVLCLGAHFGNMEALGLGMQKAFVQAQLKPFFVLAKPSRFKWANKLMEFVRDKRGFLVLWTGQPAFQNQLQETAEKGYGLALLIDQKPPRNGIFVKFFRDNAAFPSRGIGIGIVAGMAIVHITSRRKRLGQFEMLFEEGCNSHIDNDSRGGAASETVNVRTTQVLTQYAGWLENIIRAYPGHWFWDYRKWSRTEPVAQDKQPKF